MQVGWIFKQNTQERSALGSTGLLLMKRVLCLLVSQLFPGPGPLSDLSQCKFLPALAGFKHVTSIIL